MNDKWVKRTEQIPLGMQSVWLWWGKLKTPTVEHVQFFSAGYQASSDWTHWQPCEVPAPPKEPIKVRVKFWVNIYPDCLGGFVGVEQATREAADQQQRSDGSRIARILVDREVEEGTWE